MAQRIQNKRSSLPGKRPDGSYLEPGEIALNTNAGDPGLFFELSDGSIAKAGPTSLGTNPPTTEVGYGPGETWWDSGNNQLNIWDDANEQWVPSTLVGGDPRFTVFVNSQSPRASDDLSNDGVSRPFATLNRACIEVARRTILRGRLDDPYNDKYSIVLMSGNNVSQNEPGRSVTDFQTNIPAFTEDQALTPDILRSFNPEQGGVIVPRGASVYGFDLRKSIVTPTYYPKWVRANYLSNPETIPERTNVLKWTGNSLVKDLTFKDKVSEVSVLSITGDPTDEAVMQSLQPHGYRSLILTDGAITLGDLVQLSYPANVSRTYNGDPVAPEGTYYAEPLTSRTFRLRKTDGTVLLRRDLPLAPGNGTDPAEYFTLSYDNTSHHRLSSLGYATLDELNDFYTKVQTAFATLNFGGEVAGAEIASGETIIVAPTPVTPTELTDTTRNSSPYVNGVSVRSNWGLCGVVCDGSLVSGFKSVLSNELTVVSLQNDAEVFEVFYNDQWLSLTEAYAQANNVPATSVTNTQAIGYLISTVSLENLRYFYRDAQDIPSADGKSSGLADDKSDTRHYHTLVVNGGIAQVASSFCIGTAVNYWSRSGGRASIISGTSNFGGISLRSEGFAGIGTAGGSTPTLRGFTVQGVRRPRNVTLSELKDTDNHLKIVLNANINNNNNDRLVMDEPINLNALLPYSLKPGTKIWCENLSDGSQVSATLADPAINAEGTQINLETADNNIGSVTVLDLSPPYIRRFVDPRYDFEKGYSLWVNNTSSTHKPPTVGNVLRFSEDPSPSSQNLLVPGRQLDPGENGGWNHVFAVNGAVTKEDGDSPNYFAKGISTPSKRSSSYYISLDLEDNFGPWEGSLGTPTPVELEYEEGSYVTVNDRAFYAQKNQLAQVAISPEVSDSVWERGRTFSYCQPFEEAYVPSGYPAAVDVRASEFTVGMTYLRGVGPSKSDFALTSYIDADDGTDSLGLEGTGGGQAGNYGDPVYFDPEFSHSKQAVTRLLNLLGYDNSYLDTVLAPQRWSQRNLAVGTLPNPNGEGYALSKGEWPIEFNESSSISSPSHYWEWSGYFSYTKGLPQYQESPLSRVQRFDYLTSSAWGGMVDAIGLTESHEEVHVGVIKVDSRGQKSQG